MTLNSPLSEPLGEIVASRCSASLGTEDQENPRVVNVILPDHRGYFVQHLGYFLATFLLLAFVAVALIVLIRRRKKRGVYTYKLPTNSFFFPLRKFDYNNIKPSF